MTGDQREWIRARAGARCEYCHLPDLALPPGDFHVEHIIARQHRGDDHTDNLAWACMFCNLYKGPNLASIDPDSGRLTPLFDPRRQIWDDHFRLEINQMAGRTDVGRTTVWLLEMNSEMMIKFRDLLIQEGPW